MKVTSILFVTLLLAGMLLGACSSAATPTATPPVTKVATPPQQVTAAPSAWDNLVAEAKKEGTVSMYITSWTPQMTAAVAQGFKDKYGINVEFSPFSRGAELMAKVQAEQRASLFNVDIVGAGGGTLITTMKPEGVLGKIEPLLVLPEVTDAKNWSGGVFPFMDKDKTAVAMIASVQRSVLCNTGMVKQGEIVSYADLLKPQYKGKMILNDPTVTGVGNAWITTLALFVWDPARTKDYLQQLIKQQEVVVERDNRVHVETVARGKYPIGIAPNPEVVSDFLKVAAPLEVVGVKEGIFVSPAAGAIAVPSKMAHPNAGKLFANWLLGKEGQTAFSVSSGNPSLRNDVSTAGFNPMFLTQPGDTLFYDSEEALGFRGKALAMAQEVIGGAKK